MKSTPLHNLATSDAGCGDIRLQYQDLALTLDYEFRKHAQDRIGHFRFLDVVAFRFRDELHSYGFVACSYDEIVEIHSSEWIAELRSHEPPGYGRLPLMRHFAVLLSSNGYLEVVAERVVVEPPSLGLLEARDAYPSNQ